MVVAEQQVVAVAGRVERRRHHQRQEPVLHQVELVDDLRPQQAQRVGERREREARHQLLGDGGAADHRVLLEHQRAQAGLAEVRRVGEAVVAAADDDRVEVVHAFFLSGSKNGIFVVRDPHRGVVVGDGQLEPQVGALGGEVGPHPRDADVPLEHRRVDERRAVADLARRRRRAPSTRRAAGARTWAGTGRRRGTAGPSPPSRRRSPVVSQRDVPSTSSRRIASDPTKRREPSRTPRSIQPKPSSLGVTQSASLNASRAVLPLDVDQGEPGLDAQRHQGLLAERPDAVVAPRLQHGVEHRDRVVRRARSARSRGRRCSRCATA